MKMEPIQAPIHSRFEKIEIGQAEFQRLGHELVDRIAALFHGLPQRPVTTQAGPENIRQIIEDIADGSDMGMNADELLEKTATLLFDHSLFNGHPKFWGYITSSPAPIGILAELLAAAVNPNVGAWVLSPVATEIEKYTVEWIGKFIGYPAGGGLLVSGGNMANNICVLAAMRAKAGKKIRKNGLRSLEKPFTLYCSDETHTWIQKAADLYGLGTDSIRWIESDEYGRMNTVLLENKIQEDLAMDFQPFLVVGTGGSVSTGSVDPLLEISAICEKYDLWFHVDGAYGGFAAALPELQNEFSGLENADSLAVDPHKWLYTPLEAGCVLVKKPAHLTDTFSYHPPYYNFEQAGLNYIDYGPQNSRGFRALKVWLTMQYLGMEGHRQLIREDIRLASYAFEKFAGQEDFEVFTQHLSITTFRYVPPELKSQSGEKETETWLNHLNQAILNRIETSGDFFVSKAIIRSKFALRLCIVNFRTTEKDIDPFPAYVRKIGQELARREGKDWFQ